MQLQHSKITKNSVILSAVKILKLINLKETIDPADTQASWNSPAAPVNQTNHGRSNQGNNRIFSKLDLVLKDKGGKKNMHIHTPTCMHAYTQCQHLQKFCLHIWTTTNTLNCREIETKKILQH